MDALADGIFDAVIRGEVDEAYCQVWRRMHTL